MLNKLLNKINYTGGGTFTLGGFQLAEKIFNNSRPNAKKVLFLITDGYSNGGDPVPLATTLKDKHVTIFTIGIRNGNHKELFDISTSPGQLYSYLLDSYDEFEGLARRALHIDLKMGSYVPLGLSEPCNSLCEEGDCCDKNAICTCGTTTGHYSCICRTGYYGSGLKNSCLLCPVGFYSDGPNICSPCPDIQHTTVPPAYGLSSCQCKKGYRNNKKNACEIITCPEVSVPENGYLVKKRCDTVLNTACGIRCNIGYTLVGTSIRLCQGNGTWSGEEPSCQVKTCKKLPVPLFGKVSCSQIDLGLTYNGTEPDLPVDTECAFECEKGRTLIGSKERTCLPLAQWDGLKTTCKQIKCSKLLPLRYGTIEPESCLTSKQAFGTVCNIKCDKGFVQTGPKEKKCTGTHGTWTKKSKQTICKDVSPPELICPNNVTGFTQLGKKYGFVTLGTPNVTDNSDMEILLWMSPAIKNSSNFMFTIGATEIVYFAQDAFQNRANCTVFVTIKDVERPTIKNCESPPIFLTNDNSGANITWDEPDIFDNSQNLTITKTHDFGFFPLGTTKVTYSAVDSSNNRKDCSINVTVEEAACEPLNDPIFGQSDCSSDKTGMQCIITCEEGYAVPLSSPNADANSSIHFLCNHTESIWHNQEGLTFPECSVTKVSKEELQKGTAKITSDDDDCNDINKLNEIQNDLKVSLMQTCETNCTVTTEAECINEEEKETQEELTNKVKREAPAKRRKNKKKRIHVKFQIRGHIVHEQKIVSKSNVTFEFQMLNFLCPSGFIPRKNRCVQCPRGTFHNVTQNVCQSCDYGYFSDHVGQIQCTQCQNNYSTRKMRSKGLEECREQCPPGTHARKKFLRPLHNSTLMVRATLKPYCKTCQIGYYQSKYGEMECNVCPVGYTTHSFGSTSISDCVITAERICETVPDICNFHGNCVVVDEYHYSCICSNGYVGTQCQHLVGLFDSNPCLNNGTCVIQSSTEVRCACREGFIGEFCEELLPTCSLKCLNNGICAEAEDDEKFCLCPDGYVGLQCETKTSHCDAETCQNGVCHQMVNGYRCLCANGYIGKRCTILPCDFKPCEAKQNSFCVNLIIPNASKNSYTCDCFEGYTGKNCTKIDFCTPNPCANRATCRNENTAFKCDCPKLFSGLLCDIKRRTMYSLNFPGPHISNYVKLTLLEKQFSTIGACLWVRTTDSFNYGTLISYANTKYDNAFAMTDYTGLVLYVNNKYVVTDILLNDGKWYHVCATWSSAFGKFSIFVDGQLRKQGSGLSSGTIIEGNGIMILGQEQDSLGGHFSQSESFIGQMAYLDVWSKELKETDVLDHMNDCQEHVFGDVFGWPEVQDFIIGNVTIVPSSFCNSCEELPILFNGLINVVENVAYYSCYGGFELSYNYENGRKCTKAAKWEGKFEPLCKKIYCGYPGYVKNGYLIGNKFFYRDSVVYKCFDEFKLSGNGKLTCKENGLWFPSRPTCIGNVQCPPIKKPENSTLTILSEYINAENETTYEVGSQIELMCLERTKLIGENVLTCLDNGTWDFELPTCLDQKTGSQTFECDVKRIPPTPMNSIISNKSVEAYHKKLYSHIQYACLDGYHLVGENNISMCIVDGYWTEPKFTCQGVTCDPPAIPLSFTNNEKNGTVYPIGATVQFSCMDGYKMLGPHLNVTCLNTGKWSKISSSCSRISCDKPLVSTQGVIVGNSFLFEDKVTLVCPTKLEYVLSCNKFGMWDGLSSVTC